MANLNMASMKSAANAAGLKFGKGMDPTKAAEMLSEHYKNTVDESTLAACSACGYASPESNKTCPFCGTVLGESEETNTAPAKKKGAAKKDETAIEEPDPKAIEQCKSHISKIRSLRQNQADMAFDIGLEIKEINDKILWKHMGYTSFSKFCEAELEYTRVLAYMYMAITALDRDLVKQIGVSKAHMVVLAPPRQQKKLMKMALDGASRDEMKKYMNKGKKSQADNNKITLLGRIEDGNINLSWTTDENDDEFVSLDVTSTVNLMITKNDDDTGLILRFSKVDSEPEKPSETPSETPPAE